MEHSINVKVDTIIFIPIYYGALIDKTTIFEIKLAEINANLWAIEDEIRPYEKAPDFVNDFVQLTRNVDLKNDFRSQLRYKSMSYKIQRFVK